MKDMEQDVENAKTELQDSEQKRVGLQDHITNSAHQISEDAHRNK